MNKKERAIPLQIIFIMRAGAKRSFGLGLGLGLGSGQGLSWRATSLSFRGRVSEFDSSGRCFASAADADASSESAGAVAKFTLDPGASTPRGMLRNAAITLEHRDLDQAKWWADAALIQSKNASSHLQRILWTVHSIEGACLFLKGDMKGAEIVFQSAVDGCEKVAKEGMGHDAYVDMVGTVSDLAGAKAFAKSSAGNTEAMNDLKRASYMARRAYRPDGDILSVVDSNFSVVSAKMGDIEGARAYVNSALSRSVHGSVQWATATSNAAVYAIGFEEVDADVLEALEQCEYERAAAERGDLAWTLSRVAQRILLDPENDENLAEA